MKKSGYFIGLFFLLSAPVMMQAQKKALSSITKEDLKMHMEFLASDELAGRATSEPQIQVAARYLGSQARHLGLKTAELGETYFQYYTLAERAYDWDQAEISLRDTVGNVVTDRHQFFVLPAMQNDTLNLSGDVVFAGYGIIDESHEYDDLDGLDLEGKIVLIMNRAPMNEDGTESLFGEKWMSLQNMQYKMNNIAMRGPKAILIVFDPKSGMQSIADMSPQIAQYFSRSLTIKKDEEEEQQVSPSRGPKIVFVHRELADKMMDFAGKDLAEIQRGIDQSLTPNSFEIEGLTAEINLVMKETDHSVPNVFGYIEGSDPVLKNEMVIYLAHYDHIGTDGEGNAFNGADDNASGTVALLEIAQAFLAEKKAPRRSVGFLWVSGEEIGLFGSSYFADHPMVPMESISTVINLDMVGRVKTEDDVNSERSGLTIVSRDSVKVIGALQSSVLMKINEETLSEMGLHGNYTYNNINHPERYFFRSDHINFARKDIPVLFYSTGTHADYHLESDDEEKIDYDKFRKMTQFSFMAGYNVANYKGEITVDNPMSEWNK